MNFLVHALAAAAASVSVSVNLSAADELRVGASAVDITPTGFESRPNIANHDKGWKKGDPFYDTGVDGKFDFEEEGAFGADGAPGRAGVDDDGNGKIDDCDRAGCAEYLAAGSDDVKDPAHDNYDCRKNRKGTEKDGKFQFVHLAGFSPYYPAVIANRLAGGVHDPIWSRALAVRGANGVTTVLVSTDLPGLSWKYINPVRRRVEKELGIPFSNVIITSTHDHAAPDAMGYWVTLLKGRNRKYAHQLEGWMFESIRKAVLGMKPARMKTITTTHLSCMDPKTRVLKREPDCNIPPNSTDYKGPHGQDYDIQIIQNDKRDPIVRNTSIVAAQFIAVDGSGTIGTFLNWHNHPDTLGSGNVLISSDYSHYLRTIVERRLGGVAVYFTGTLGSQIGGTAAPWWTEDMIRLPDHALADDGWEQIRSIGFEVGNEAVLALEAALPDEAAVDVTVRTETIRTRIDNFLHEFATKSVWKSDVERPDRMSRKGARCLFSKYGCVRSDMSVLTIGELGIVTAPGEIDPSYFLGREASVADYGEKGKWKFPAMPGWITYMPGKHKAVLGQANNYLSYLVHKADNVGWWNFKHPNHYEEFVTVSKNFGDEAGDQMMKMLGSPLRYDDAPELEAVDPPTPWTLGDWQLKLDKTYPMSLR